ncbi:MAG: PepSY-associated TM helix domain-containing protein [Pseudomonadales bacterium]|jgi:hypothetical protein|nr:PepSY-associated TM helix domain-containing protein [Pseudomonadales bacterium]
MAINRTLVQWSRTIHIYLSVALLTILLFFAFTGITLNHATDFSGEPAIDERTLDTLPALPQDAAGMIADSPELAQFLRSEFGLRRKLVTLETEDTVLLVDYRAPGRSVLLEIDAAAGTAHYEATDFGLIAFLNDLHKGRDTGVIWKHLLDISGVLAALFSLAGFVLLLPNRYRFKRITAYSLLGFALIGAGYWLAAM